MSDENQTGQAPKTAMSTSTTSGNVTMVSALATVLAGVAAAHGVALDPVTTGGLITLITGALSYILPHR